ncbi:FCD domain-containing protein [Actinoplanes sp. NPDC051851]|uniref:FadR/GntR family transcriptional regulator n=1 Tax=Actinoplanes sp. NPDC051851 TaxID=3154753 RepID=UPI00341EE2E5
MPAQSDQITAALAALPGSTPVSEVARRLLDLFTSGSIAPGTRLPAERQLATTLQVGRSAIREALAALEILGIVDVRPGSGTYLRGTASELLPQTLRWGLLIGERNTTELLELRAGLEVYVARLAAGRASTASLTKLRKHLSRMNDSIDDLTVFARADRDFHQTLAETAGNGTLIDLLHTARSLLRVYAERAVHDRAAAATALAEHEAVLLAIERGDEDGAASAMAAHMTTASARVSAS